MVNMFSPSLNGHNEQRKVLSDGRENKVQIDRRVSISRGTCSVVGQGNRVEFGKDCHIENLEIVVRGDFNDIAFGAGCILKNVKIRIESDMWDDFHVKKNVIRAGNFVNISNVDMELIGSLNSIVLGGWIKVTRYAHLQCRGYGSDIRIGKNTSIQGATLKANELRTQLLIGEDCMLATGITIATSDDHPIFADDGSRHNPAKSVGIGRHVWIGDGATLLKGTEVGSGCVIAAGSLINRKFVDQDGNLVANAIAAGRPAEIRTRGVTWNRDMVYGESDCFPEGASREENEIFADAFAQSCFSRGHMRFRKAMDLLGTKDFRSTKVEFNAAIEMYEKVTALKPGFLFAHIAIANAYYELGSAFIALSGSITDESGDGQAEDDPQLYLEKSVECYDAALALSPEHLEPKWGRWKAVEKQRELARRKQDGSK